MKTLFGTDGIRGVAGCFPLDPATVSHIGQALGEYLVQLGGRSRAIIGRDTRESGGWISEWLKRVLASSGTGMIHDAGIITTPGLAFLTRSEQYHIGIMISASHNPYEDNGIKLFSQDGFKLSDEVEAHLEERIYRLIENKEAITKSHRATAATDCQGLIRKYKEFLAGQLKGSLDSYRIGLDVSNGAAFSIAPAVFRELGAAVTVINQEPNGKNINENCGSLHLQGLKDLVASAKLSFGVAFDGDADRSLFVTRAGKVFDGDYVLYALSRDFKKRAELKSNKVVGTVMSNFALEQALRKENLELVRAAVGDKYVLEEMGRVGANLGGEPSGHVILMDYQTTGDGILTAIKLTEILCRERVGLDELTVGFRPFPQALDGLRVRLKIPIESPQIQVLIEDVRKQLTGSGRILVRYSGTEPILRIMAEGEDAEQVWALVGDLKSKLQAVFSSFDASAESV